MRADKFFAERFGSRTKAAQAIEKGWVLLDGAPIRVKDEISSMDGISIEIPTETFVSNGGYKLSKALHAFGFDCKDKTFVDIGASTGGFTDCLLQSGAKKVYTVDVGESLLDERLLESGKIVQMENTNARYLTSGDFTDGIDGIVTDVSFISLRLIFPAIAAILSENGDALVLIKPQFECENKNISKNGIVHPSSHTKIVEKVLCYAEECGLYASDIVHAPIRKGKNIEYVVWLKKTKQAYITKETIIQKVDAFVRLGEWKSVK